MLDRQFDQIDAARDVAGEKLDPGHGLPFLDLVDLLANPGAESPGPEALRDEAEFAAATITSVGSHRFALVLEGLSPRRAQTSTGIDNVS
jgi:hypothetical protein